MKTPLLVFVLASMAWCALPGEALRAGGHENAIVESSTAVIDALAAIPFKGIPPALLQDAQGVAIIPNVIKAGFVIGGRHGRGVILVRQPDGCWSNPVFLSLTGGSIGWQIGVQSTDVVLVFKTRNSLDRIIKGKGKLTLGADVGVAAGPIGRQAEAGTDGQLKAEIYSYSRSRGLFAGVSVEGGALLVDADADEAFYGLQSVRPADILAMHGVPVPAVAERLKAQVSQLSGAVMMAPPVPLQYTPVPVQPDLPLPRPLPPPPPMPLPPPPPVAPPPPPLAPPAR